MKVRLIVLFIVFVLIGQIFLPVAFLQTTAFAAVGEINTSKWMDRMKGNKKLSEFSIPGTHATCALHGGVGVECQSMSLADQLNAGVRYIDIRCRHIDNVFTIYHGSYCENIDFASGVRDVCLEFLKNNPTECIIMHVKEQNVGSNCTQSFEDTFNSYLSSYEDKWYLGDTIPKLGDVRGKIVLLRGFKSKNTPMGIDVSNWEDNSTFVIKTSKDQTLRIQDEYKFGCTEKDNKWEKTEKLLNEAADDSLDKFYINYTSAEGKIFDVPAAWDMAQTINPRIESYFASRAGRYGVIATDFINSDLSKTILKSNTLINPGKTFMLTAACSNKVLDVQFKSTYDGANVIQNGWNGGDNQKWRIDLLPDGYYKLTSINSEKVLEVEGGRTEDGARIQQWSWNGGDNQKWRLDFLPDGYYQLINVNSGKALDVYYSGINDGITMQQYHCNDTDAQKWVIEECISSGTVYNLISANSGKSLDVCDFKISDSTNTWQFVKNYNNIQKWRIDLLDDGCYKLININSGKALEVVQTDDVKVQQRTWDGSDTQRWRIEYVRCGRFKLIAKCSNKVLEGQNIGTNNCTNVKQCDWDGGSAQQWIIEEVIP